MSWVMKSFSRSPLTTACTMLAVNRWRCRNGREVILIQILYNYYYNLIIKQDLGTKKAAPPKGSR